MTELLEPTISKRKVAKKTRSKTKPVHLADKLCEQANNTELNRKSNSGPAEKTSQAATSIASDASIGSDTANIDVDETSCFVRGYN